MDDKIVGIDLGNILDKVVERTSQHTGKIYDVFIVLAYIDAVTIVHELFSEIFDTTAPDVNRDLRTFRMMASITEDKWTYEEIHNICVRFHKACWDRIADRTMSGHPLEVYAYLDTAKCLLDILVNGGYDAEKTLNFEKLDEYRKAFDE